MAALMLSGVKTSPLQSLFLEGRLLTVLRSRLEEFRIVNDAGEAITVQASKATMEMRVFMLTVKGQAELGGCPKMIKPM